MITPFLDLDEQAGSHAPGRRFLCFMAEVVLRIICWSLALMIVAAIAYKALAPLP